MKKQTTIPDGYVRVTEVLKPFCDFSSIDPKVLENAADRGTRTHAFCEAYALNLFLPEVDKDCKPYFDSYCYWFDRMVDEVYHVEPRINHERYRLSGQIDLICRLKGDDCISIVDLKTPQVIADSWKLQTAAYKILTESIDIKVSRRMCLQLSRVGAPPKVVEYDDHEKHERLYLAALELYHFFNQGNKR